MTKINYGQIILLGLGFLGVSLLWAVYNAYVPIFLQAGNPKIAHTGYGTPVSGFGLSAFATGVIMSLDNIAAVFIQPWIGLKSDRTRTRLGRRLPFVLMGAPLSAIGLMAIPCAVKLIPPAQSGQITHLMGPFALLVTALGLTLLASAVYRTPAAALLPDIVPSHFRSQATGIINVLGGLGVVIGWFGGGWLFDQDVALPFLTGGLILLLTSGLMVLGIKERPPHAPEISSAQSPGLFDYIEAAWRTPDKSAIYLLLAIFTWFLAYNTLETFFTSYASFELGIATGQAARLFTVAGGVFMAAAIPVGYLAGKFGRKRIIIGGLVAFMGAVLLIWSSHQLILISAALVIVGLGWAMININSLPMVLDSVPAEQAGAYTGLYYFASMSAAIIGPMVIGRVIDTLGYRAMFGAAAAALAVAALLLGRVTRGEALPETILTIEQAGIP